MSPLGLFATTGSGSAARGHAICLRPESMGKPLLQVAASLAFENMTREHLLKLFR